MRSAAGLVMVLGVGACGGGGGGSDASESPADAPHGGDASGSADASLVAGRVDVVVRGNLGDGAPDPTAIAIFTDPSGATVQHGVVDAEGRAHAELLPHGSVTVLQISQDEGSFSRYVNLITIRDVAPGDVLEVGNPRRPDFHPEPPAATMIANVVRPPGTTQSDAVATCLGSTGTGTFDEYLLRFWDSCASGTFDLLAFAYNTDPPAQYYLWKGATPIEDEAHVTIDGTWQTPRTTTLTVENFPGQHYLGAGIGAYFGPLLVSIGGGSFGQNPPPPGTQQLVMRYIPEAGPRWRTHVVLSAGLVRRQEYFRFGPAPGTAFTVDLASLPLPIVSGFVHQTKTGGTWSEAYAGNPDWRSVRWLAHWTDPDGITHSLYWEFDEPPQSGAALALPSLPVEYAAEDPTALDPDYLHLDDAGVTYVDYTNLDGYAEAREYGPHLRWVDVNFADVDHEVKITNSF